MRFLRRNWRTIVVLGMALGLLALLLHPVVTHGPALAAFVLLPVLLFGLVLAPLSLWPAGDLEQRWVAPVLCRAHLFQRPPPSCKN